MRFVKNILGQLDIFSYNSTDEETEKPVVPIEPEVIEVKGRTRARKPKATYDEVFGNIKTTQVHVDELSEEERICEECGSVMEPIGTKVVRTEIIYNKPSLERIEYVANTYICPNYLKESETQFLKELLHTLCITSMLWLVLCIAKRRIVFISELKSAEPQWSIGLSHALMKCNSTCRYGQKELAF